MRKIIKDYNIKLLDIMKEELKKEDYSTKEIKRLAKKIIEDMKELERFEKNN